MKTELISPLYDADYDCLMVQWPKVIIAKSYIFVYTVNPSFKPQGLIDFMVHNYLGSNRERVEIKT